MTEIVPINLLVLVGLTTGVAALTLISSVSGASTYAAYFGLNGPSADSTRTFEERLANLGKMRYLGRSINGDLVDYRDLQAVISNVLQSNATLSTLNQPNKTIVLLSASDMVTGQPFRFDPESFDDLCMNYGQFPLSLAVVASAASPPVFAPVALRNNSYLPSGCPGRRNEHLSYGLPLQITGGAYANLATYRNARYRQSLRNEMVREHGADNDIPPYRTPVYLRLVDGGVADNSGLTGLRQALLTPGQPADIGRLVAQGKLRHLVVIAVNAHRDPESRLDTSIEDTTTLAMAEAISGTLIDSASANSALVFQQLIKALADVRDRLVGAGQIQANFAIYPISIDFDQLPDATAAQRQEQRQVKAIATNWTLQPGDLALLHQVAGKLLWRHPCFRALVADIGLQGNPEADAVPNTRCPVKPP